MKRIVITGPTGVIGRALIDIFIQKKIEVLAICREGSVGLDTLPKSVYLQVVECDLSRLEFFVCKNTFDTFYHFAWEGTIGESRNDVFLQNRNVKYTLDAVKLAKRLGCHTFIGAGSQAEYGKFEGKLTSKTPTFPITGYGIAKLCAGQMSRILCRNLDMKHIWTRVLSVYGPNDDEKTMIMTTINDLLDGKVPKFTKGEQMWDYLYSEDAASAFYLLGKRGLDGKVYCLGSGEVRPLFEYIYEIRNIIDCNLKIDMGAIPYKEDQVMFLCADIAEIQEDVGFTPSIDFPKGIKKIISYLT